MDNRLTSSWLATHRSVSASASTLLRTRVTGINATCLSLMETHHAFRLARHAPTSRILLHLLCAFFASRIHLEDVSESNNSKEQGDVPRSCPQVDCRYRASPPSPSPSMYVQSSPYRPIPPRYSSRHRHLLRMPSTTSSPWPQLESA